MSEISPNRELCRSPIQTQWNGCAIKPDVWGKDHISTLLYVESICVDSNGVPDQRKMRSKPDNPKRTQEHDDFDTEVGCLLYPTRLKGGVELFGHDDWDCVDDFIAVGMVTSKGTGANPVYELTDYGWMVAGHLRRARAEGRKVSEITIPAKV